MKVFFVYNAAKVEEFQVADVQMFELFVGDKEYQQVGLFDGVENVHELE